MAYTKKERISIALSKETCARIDNLCKKMGTSRSKLCASVVEQHIESMEQFWDLFNSPNQMTQLIQMMEKTTTEVKEFDSVLTEFKNQKK